ncbi:hypothetical protein H696_00360 [Fonticula alba]|uniref:Phosphoglucomutase n=1 Tax=Fonticula alba TaxID=691883 RepID=A0A058ZFQ2_FONAL|nr:hypothetical protein H696_00360 [Fonticula alba]KCV72781.1 hypothetical protein H696_00360 [Fonticula alba]|eukprot:XP_009492482.1 hypothetical protein H696_00360 [Fonticula alba]
MRMGKGMLLRKARPPLCPATRDEIADLRAAGDWAKLDQLLTTRVSFGTAGLRASVGAGFSRLNDLVIIQTTQGYLRYLSKIHGPQILRDMGVVIGHDHRHGSLSFAHLSAGVFLRENIPVHLFRTVVHTPMVPFAVRHLGAAAGIMITASHNPKQDNGYKVYSSIGTQIVAPADEKITEFILSDLRPRHWDSDIWRTSLLCHDPGHLIDAYMDNLVRCSHLRRRGSLELPYEPMPTSEARIVYTALHGVGQRYLDMAFERTLLPAVISVAEQAQPNPDFPTVQYPNPEEGKGTLQMAIDLANSTGADVILANDPDADRLGVAVRLPAGPENAAVAAAVAAAGDAPAAPGAWRLLTGNEIGLLLAAHLYATRTFHQEPVAMLTTAVSSGILHKVALHHGFLSETTLTGFKWLGNRTIELKASGYHVLFAYEEAIGYMVDANLPEKDGISAAVVFAELVHQLYASGKTLLSELRRLESLYGVVVNRNSYLFSPSPATTKSIFEEIRRLGDYVTTESDLEEAFNVAPSAKRARRSAPFDTVFEGTPFRVASVRDVSLGVDTAEAGNQSRLPLDHSAMMITLRFAEPAGAVVTLRASGTEPKLKYYSEISSSASVAPEQVDIERRTLKDTLDNLVDTIVEKILQPQRYQLRHPAH